MDPDFSHNLLGALVNPTLQGASSAPSTPRRSIPRMFFLSIPKRQVPCADQTCGWVQELDQTHFGFAEVMRLSELAQIGVKVSEFSM